MTRSGSGLATVSPPSCLTMTYRDAVFCRLDTGITVVPINAEEPTEKKRYILEHSEASVSLLLARLS